VPSCLSECVWLKCLRSGGAVACGSAFDTRGLKDLRAPLKNVSLKPVGVAPLSFGFELIEKRSALTCKWASSGPPCTR